MWFRKLIIFLIRKRLGLSKYESFKFDNQGRDNDAVYFFNEYALMKNNGRTIHESHVGLNYILSNKVNVIVEEQIPD